MPDTRSAWLDIEMERLVNGGIAVLKHCDVVLPDGSRHELIIKGFNLDAQANQPSTVSVELFDHRVRIKDAPDA